MWCMGDIRSFNIFNGNDIMVCNTKIHLWIFRSFFVLFLNEWRLVSHESHLSPYSWYMWCHIPVECFHFKTSHFLFFPFILLYFSSDHLITTFNVYLIAFCVCIFYTQTQNRNVQTHLTDHSSDMIRRRYGEDGLFLLLLLLLDLICEWQTTKFSLCLYFHVK